MHRTVNGKYLLYRYAEVNGTKPKSLRYRLAKQLTNSKIAEQEVSLLSSKFVYMGVLSGDFAIVDVREGLCEPEPAERGKFRGVIANGQ